MIAYLDCIGGLAGDMLLAACLGAGADAELLRTLPERLGIDHVELRATRVERHAISAIHVRVVTAGGVAFDGEHQTRHPHRSWGEIRALLESAELEDEVRTRSIEVFAALARAEARTHNVSMENVHFHELGAADTLVDVCGGIVLLRDLGVERLLCSPLPAGRGTTQAAHGVLPLPAPATVELLKGAPIFGVELDAELVTPTGAALAATLADEFGPVPSMTLERIGYGAGTHDFPERPNLLRLLLGTKSAVDTSEVALLETNLDDLLPELAPDAVEGCFAAGALDVWTTPAQMKKGRPGFVLAALARLPEEAAVARAILETTSALGVRVSRLHRYELEREERMVDVEGKKVRVKVGRLEGRVVNVAPEHDDCAAVAAALGRPAKSIWAAALAAAGELE
jgi:uncharacterized protein (TIGR00299 family) protein